MAARLSVQVLSIPPLVFRKKLVVLGFRLFMPPLFPVDIRDADRPGQSALPLVDHSEFGDLKFPALECLPVGQVCLALGPNAGAPCCNEPPIP